MTTTNTEVDPVQKALDVCRNTNYLIEINAKSLKILRLQCTRNNDFIQKEILENEVLETKYRTQMSLNCMLS